MEKEAVSVISAYYAAMNHHDVSKAIAFLDEAVVVTFPEKERNWSSKAFAAEKFGGMFERTPSFNCSFTVDSIAQDHDEVGKQIFIVTCNCRFQSVDSDSSRIMLYNVKDNRIARIEHL